jgi:ATP diphosphatase
MRTSRKKKTTSSRSIRPGQFEQILKTQNLTEDDVHRILRQQLIVEKAVSANINISEADIKSYLDKNHATLDTQEQVRARHILVPDLATANKVEDQLKAGAKFEDLAAKYSTDPSSKVKGGELGFFSKGQMVPTFQAAAFSQPLNVVGPPVKSPFGYHIIEVEEKKPAQIATLASAHDKIKTLLTQQQDQQAIPPFLASLRSKASITIDDDKLKDALPPVAPPTPATTGAHRRSRARATPICSRSEASKRCARVGRAVTLLAPPELALFLESEGMRCCAGASRPALFVRGSSDEIEALRRRLDGEELALGVLGNPLSDFPGLPMLLRALERAATLRTRARHAARDARRVARDAAGPLPPGSSARLERRSSRVMARLRRSCPVGPRADARIARALPDRRDLRSRRRDRERHDGDLCEELGDLLLQIVFHAQLATERGKFSIADVVDALSNKMIRRHPHVFGDVAVASVAEVWQNWDQLKALEPAARNAQVALDGIPKGLGRLQRAQKMQEKAARVGFDWPDVDGVRAKLAEELAELEEARRSERQGGDPRGARRRDLHLRQLAGALGEDAEGAMRDANEKFYRRFTFMERRADTEGRKLGDLSLDELEELWQLAKLHAA